jgi:hypothetical protein
MPEMAQRASAGKIVDDHRIPSRQLKATPRLSRLGSEFDDFLFAPIGEDRNGMLLSVLSALARLDVDPWQEAAKLALLPRETATERLASLIAALPDGQSAHLDPGTVAARLMALLPSRAHSNIASRATFLGVGAAINSQAVIQVIFYAILMAFVLGAQSIVASRQPPAQVDNAHAPASSTDSPQTPPTDSGQ